jgi:hypothetical protein
MSGEVSKWSDSDNKLHLIHVGASDGDYHTFTTGSITLSGDARTDSDLTVNAVAEENKISENEQNTDFSTFAGDFLDFSESNPFGDPENN